MEEKEAGKYWNGNAQAWTALSRAGFDVYRDHLNTPSFLEMLPHIDGLSGIDIGCGEGNNTRLLAQIGGNLTGVDISEIFIENAKASERNAPLGIDYIQASATNLPFKNDVFDFATSFMCLMDIPDPAAALKEAYRVIKRNGFLQFSITHPCYTTPHRKNLRTASGETYAIEVGNYFKKLNGRIEEWIFGEAPNDLKMKFPKFKIPVFNFTLTEWVNMIIGTGFSIEKINEPYPENDMVRQYPALQDAQIIAYFLHFRCRKW